jgi:uncharacterized protein
MIIGLISDTHMPDRCAVLPSALFEALRGVDLLLHAGDVGDLDVLDQLSAIAPVVAVHGNDELDDAPAILPYQQVIAVAGTRIVLTHGHYPDRAEELASRRDDSWESKLDRRAAFGQQTGAAVVVFGHTHIPLAFNWNGMLLVNPGAIAPPNYTTRQTVQSVARLDIDPDGGVAVTHINLVAPDQPFVPSNDISVGFRALFARYTDSILAADLAAQPYILQAFHELLPESQLRNVLRRAAWPCWYGDRPHVATTDLHDALVAEPDIAEDVQARLLELVSYMT